MYKAGDATGTASTTIPIALSTFIMPVKLTMQQFATVMQSQNVTHLATATIKLTKQYVSHDLSPFSPHIFRCGCMPVYCLASVG